MGYMRGYGFMGWLASMGMLAPGMPSQCDPVHHPAGVGGATADAGSGAIAGATSTVAGSGAIAGAAGDLAVGGSGPCDSHCSASCSGCPIRVDPAASTDGSGRDWEHPANQIQSALDRQAERGGGEVWVLGGDFDLVAVDGQPGFAIPSNVTLKGGFSVNGAPTVTRLHGIRNAALLTIASSTAVRVEDLSLADGDPPFVIQASNNVVLENVTVDPYADYTNNALRIEASEVHLEQCSISLPMVGYSLVMTGSDVTITDSSFDSLGLYSSLSPKLSADSTRLLVQRSRVARGIMVDEASQALIVDSTLPNTYAPGAALFVDGSAAAIGTEFGMGYGDASVHVNGSAIIFDSSFTGLATSIHGSYPVAWAIAGTGSLDVSLTSFLGGTCSYPRDTPCPAIEAGGIDNSFFVVSESAGAPYDPQTLLTLDGLWQPSNCAVVGSHDSYGNSRLDGPYPCVDQGDAARLSASQARLLEYTAPFRAAPFNVDLGRYLNSDFWRSEAVTSSACGDTNAPDPGRHFPCTP